MLLLWLKQNYVYCIYKKKVKKKKERNGNSHENLLVWDESGGNGVRVGVLVVLVWFIGVAANNGRAEAWISCSSVIS